MIRNTNFNISLLMYLINKKKTFLCSFDVKSLFTNVPLNEVIDICGDTLYSLENPFLVRKNFISLMKLANEEVEFSFNNVLYRQIDGIAMGWGPL